jgi:hypothetical protein
MNVTNLYVNLECGKTLNKGTRLPPEFSPSIWYVDKILLMESADGI